jgi:hypothetical protein
MTTERYKSGHHLPRVKRAAKVRMGAWQVLSALGDRSEFDRPEVTITKMQIHKATGLERKAIQRGLAELRAKGVITAIDGAEGGRGVAVTYRLNIIADATEQTAQEQIKRKCPPELFSRWHKMHGLDEAIYRKNRYESGENIQ